MSAGAREALAELLPTDVCGEAFEAAGSPLVVLDSPQPGARDAAEALRAAGVFAFFDDARLVCAGPRARFVSARAAAGSEGRRVVEELLRAYDADCALAPRLRLRRYTLDLAARATVVGILNVTPDSFFDGGAYDDVERARRRAAEMVAQGAGVIDVGGQSYADGAGLVEETEECRRVVPVVEALVRDGIGVPISVDTYKRGVARAALEAGVDLVNDCSGLGDPRLAEIVAAHDAGLVVMHLKGRLSVRDAGTYHYDDVMGEVSGFLRDAVDRARAAGVSRDSIVVDPGLEFGKEPDTDLEILGRFGELRSLGYPILFAASRKSFLGRVFDRTATELLIPSLAAASVGIAAGARLVRAHDVSETCQVAALHAAVSQEKRSRR